MPMTIFLDTTRLLSRILRSAPTGIDRVEFALARELTARAGGDGVGVVTTPFANGAFGTADLAAKVSAARAAWGNGENDVSARVVDTALRAALAAPFAAHRAPQRIVRIAPVRALARLADLPKRAMAVATPQLPKELRRTRKRPRVYLHASHTQLDSPRRFAWLQDHDVPAAFMIHDTIPLDFPEFCSPGADRRHTARLETVARAADVVIVNSEATRRSLAFHLSGIRPNLRIETVPLGVGEAFHADGPAMEGANPYFVVVGTIEPRKNLLFLLSVWRSLARARGPATPRLVVVGRRGWENEMVLDVLERSVGLASHVIEVTGLADDGLASLLRGAAALLAPSEVEGFGLPVAEALACGTPVVASDIDAHREVARDSALLLKSNDGTGWLSAIEQLSDRRDDLRDRMRADARSYKPVDWPASAAAALAIADGIARLPRRPGDPSYARSLTSRTPAMASVPSIAPSTSLQ